MKNWKVIALIITISLIVIVAGCLIINSLTKLKKEESDYDETKEVLSDNSGENIETIEKSIEWFEEYLEPLKYFTTDLENENLDFDDEEILRYFVVMTYIKKEPNDFIELSIDSDYSSYIDIPQNEISELLYKYFGIKNYKLSDYEGEYFYKIETVRGKTRIYIKAIGLEICDVMKITHIDYNEDKVNLNVFLMYSGYASYYTAEVELLYKDGNYFITKIQHSELKEI